MLRHEAVTVAPQKSRRRVAVIIANASAILLVALGLAFVVQVGLDWRARLWDYTAPVRFHGDIENGMGWGGRVLRDAHRLAGVPEDRPRELTFPQFWAGYVGLYDGVYDEAYQGFDPKNSDRLTPQFNLDYTPLRLLTMSLWMRGVREGDPSVHDGGQYRDDLVRPLLRFNTAMELWSAAAMLLLVYHWLRQTRRGVAASFALAGGSASLLWLNPALLLDAHAWPQWDVWCLPFYLTAAWAASLGLTRRWPAGWWAAGALVALGAMFKGQILMAAPVLLLWPVLTGRPGATLSVLGGVASGVALATWPWLVTTVGGYWTAGVLIVAVALCLWRPRGPAEWTLAVAAALAFTLWPIPAMTPATGWPLLALAAIALPTVPLLARRVAARLVWLASLAGACVLVAGYWLDGSWSWLAVGFLYPTVHYPMMASGSTANGPAVLAGFYGWRLKDAVPLDWLALLPGIDAAGSLEMKRLLTVLASAGIALAAVAVAAQGRRRDARVLMAFAAPWVVGFALLPQMHERYLLWGACVSAAAVVLGPAGLLLHLVLTAAAAGMIYLNMLKPHRAFSPRVLMMLRGALPGFGWATVVLAICCLTIALTPGRRRVKSPA